MGELTRDQILERLRRAEKLDRADLRGVDLAKAALPSAALGRADLEGANLGGTNLRGAVLKNASLREAFLVAADLRDANLEGADLEEANLERANLSGANLTRANLEGANLTGANLTGAKLSFAQMGIATLTGADLKDAVLAHAELGESQLSGIKAVGADFTGANLRKAILTDGDFTRAVFADARLGEARLTGAKLVGASLHKAELARADLAKADLTDADLRQASFSGAILHGAVMTGVKVAGLIGTGSAMADVQVAWVDASPEGNGASRITDGEIPALLTGLMQRATRALPPDRRYFGRGDVLRNAALEFSPGAKVEIDSVFENCSIKLGEGTSLVVGEAGVLADCQISGDGEITVHGHFFERESPGIIGPRALVVTAKGALVASLQQPASPTRFAFERGCRLRLKVIKPTGEKVTVVAPPPEPTPPADNQEGTS
jgi:uncharacterized protein YjbI with pentapeptide repeats